MDPRLLRVLAAVVTLLVATGLVAVGVLPVPVLVLSIPFLYVAFRRPVLARLAARNASRRPRETTLVLLGALFGTAIITGSGIVGDTLESSIRQSAFTQLGPVDVMVSSSGTDAFPAIVEAVGQLPEDQVDGMITTTRVSGAVATTGERRRAEPNASLIELDFKAARSFGGDPNATGIAGPTPSGDHVVIGEDLADDLEASAGDTVEVFAYGQSRTFVVDRILPRVGLAGLFGFGSHSPNLFLPPGTIAGLAAAAPETAAPPASIVLVSAEGGILAGGEAARSLRLTNQIDALLGDLPASPQRVKFELLRDAEAVGSQFTELFTSIGFFSVIAGILLLVNIFVMLAEERKTEMGMLRAIGLRRAGLVGTFSLEGWFYALASAALGTVAGLGVGRAIVYVTAGIFSSDDFPLDVRYTAHLTSIQRGFVIGFVISLVTVLLTAVWVSRLNVIRAIRDLPNPAATRQRITTLVLGALAVLAGGALTTGGLSAQDPFRLLIGPAVLGIGVVPILRRFLPARPLISVVAGLVLFWAVAAFDIAGDAFSNPDIGLFVVSGVILTASAVALVSQNQETIGRVVRRVGGGARSMALRLGLAYPLARRFRTGMILAMYSLVVFTMAALLLFSEVFKNQIDDFTADVSGGFDLRMSSNSTNPVPSGAVSEVPGVEAVAALTTVGAEFQRPHDDHFHFWPASSYDETYVKIGPPSLGERMPQYADEASVYRAVAQDPSLVIVDEFFLQMGGPPEDSVAVGDTITIRDRQSGATRELTVAALSDAGFGQSPALISGAVMQEMFGRRAVPNTLLIATSPGADPSAVASQLNGRFLENGADADSFRDLVSGALAQQQQFLSLMEGYLALGLVVGIAGLGVVMVRAVRERRREVGVLRSLGFDSSQVRRAFVLESAFVALEGILIGASLAVVSTWRMMDADAFGDGLEFVIPWRTLSILVLGTLAVSLLATVTPAQQASRIRPAVALRITD